MRILHYLFGLPPVHKGGVPAYVLDLVYMQQELGNQVYMLMPGKIEKKSHKMYISPKRRYKTQCYEIVNSSYIANEYGVIDPDYFMRSASRDEYRELLKDKQIQILHLHSLLGLQIELLLAAKELKIPILYTTHDYYGLCPKIDLLKNDTLCMANDWKECIACCQQAYSLSRLRFRQTIFYRWYCHMPFVMKTLHSQTIYSLLDKLCLLRKMHTSLRTTNDTQKEQKFRVFQQYLFSIFKLIDYCHFNSLQSKEIYEAHMGALNGEVLTITKADIRDNRKQFSTASKLRIGYLGTPDKKKGYYYLLKQLDNLYASGRTEFQLKTYFIKETERRAYQKNHTPFSPKQKERVYRSMDLLIVPSIWKETFGLVVLEALSFGVPVFLSENVGAKDILYQYPGTGCVFSLDNDCLTNILVRIYDDPGLLNAMNKTICTSDISFDYKGHVLKMIEVYTKLLNLKADSQKIEKGET